MHYVLKHLRPAKCSVTYIKPFNRLLLLSCLEYTTFCFNTRNQSSIAVSGMPLIYIIVQWHVDKGRF
jgi:hypothetical protein